MNFSELLNSQIEVLETIIRDTHTDGRKPAWEVLADIRTTAKDALAALHEIKSHQEKE